MIRKGEEGLVQTQVTLAQNLEAPVETGQILGQLEVLVDGQLRDTIPIVSAQSVDRLTIPGIFQRMLRQLTMAE